MSPRLPGPEAGDPLTAQVRAQRAGAAVLRAVASRGRPVVFFVDDLQWAGRTALGFVDLVLSEEPVDSWYLDMPQAQAASRRIEPFD